MIKDVADLYVAEGEGALQILDELRKQAKDALALSISEAPPKEDTLSAYRYFKAKQLPLLMRLEDPAERRAALEDIAGAQGLKVNILQKALAEAEKEAKEEKEAAAKRSESEESTEEEAFAPEPGSERYENAMALLRRPDVLQKAAEAMERLGHVGELQNKLAAFVCAVSAKAGMPIQPSTHAQSATGKNFLWDIALKLLPQEMVIRRSGLSAKALFRTDADLRGRVLYLQELAGTEDAEYTIRVLQSAQRLEYEATEKAPDGSMRNVVYEKEGPVVVVQTTTRNHLHPENETRVFPIYLDESQEQTELIVEAVLEEASGGGISDEEKQQIQQTWQDAIRLLQEGDIIIPYAKRIELPTAQVRMRRDVRRLLDVIRVIAWLRQYGREHDEQGRIVAAEEDFHTALNLVEESFTRAWKVMTPAEEKVMDAIKELPLKMRTTLGFKRKDLDDVPGVSDRRLNEILKSLTDTGYLECDGRSGPQGYEYTISRSGEVTALGISLRPAPEKTESAANEHNSD
jgi:hypothetical protein